MSLLFSIENIWSKSFYYKEIQKEKKETGKVERALAIPGNEETIVTGDYYLHPKA
jgi:hypothetical protein